MQRVGALGTGTENDHEDGERDEREAEGGASERPRLAGDHFGLPIWKVLLGIGIPPH